MGISIYTGGLSRLFSKAVPLLHEIFVHEGRVCESVSDPLSA